MKSKDFAAVLIKFADVLGAADSRHTETAIRMLATIFDVAPTATVADVLKRLSAVGTELGGGHPTIQASLTIVRQLHNLMTGQAKATLLGDISALEAFLVEHSNVGLAQLADAAPRVLAKPSKKQTAPVRNDLVTKYTQRLEEALGDEQGFVTAYKELESDTNVGKLEAAAIAKAFTGNAGATKPAAMKKIWARHHNLMTLRAKSQARDGRSAA